MNLESSKKFKLPGGPGVYFFLKGNKILYVGKATSLKSRVRSYFRGDLFKTRGPITADMVFKADKIKWQQTGSVLEALILEANLIKKHQPYYNIKEKDDKSFNYVCITKEKLPKVLIVRGKNLGNYNGVFFGPYPNGLQLREALRIIRRIFPFIDETSNKKNNQEFYKQIHLNPETLEAYLRDIKYIKLFLNGKKKNIFNGLKKKMLDLAKLHEFEQADKIKKQIFALQHINDIALLKNESSSSNTFRIEAYDIAHMGGKNMVGVMVVVENGEVLKSGYRKFKIRTQSGTNDTGALKEVLERRLLHTEWPYPAFIVVDGGIAQINAAQSAVKKVSPDISVVSVVKDERHRPKAIMGDKETGLKYKKEILLANSEAHRFAIAYHKNMRNKNFLK